MASLLSFSATQSVVFGYIYEVNIDKPRGYIPLEICQMIHGFYHSILGFDIFNDRVFQMNRNYIYGINSNTSGCYLVYAHHPYKNKGYNKGVHLWSIKCNKLCHTFHEGCHHDIGIISCRNKNYTIKPLFTRKYENDGVLYKGFENVWKQGNIITVKLDCNNWTVTFYVMNKSSQITFGMKVSEQTIERNEYYFVLHLCVHNNFECVANPPIHLYEFFECTQPILCQHDIINNINWQLLVELFNSKFPHYALYIDDVDPTISYLSYLFQYYKRKGNDLMRNRKIKVAMDMYSKAIDLRLLGKDKENEQCEISIQKRKAMIYCNRSGAYIYLRQYEQAINDAISAIRNDPLLVKAWIKKGIAEQQLKRYKIAYGDYHVALTIVNQSDKCYEFLIAKCKQCWQQILSMRARYILMRH
eukprot:98037_1